MALLGAHASNHKHSGCIQATLQRARWVPGSARLVLLAARANGAGCLRVYELQGAGLALRGEAASVHALHSGTFGASSLAERHLAAGDASGPLLSHAWGLECTVPTTTLPTYLSFPFNLLLSASVTSKHAGGSHCFSMGQLQPALPAVIMFSISVAF